MSVDSQRKRNSNQSRPNVAQPNPSNKKNSSNKQNQIQNQPPQNSKQNQNQQLSKSAAPAAAPPPKTKSPPPPPPAELEPHVPLEGFNGDQIDALLNGGEENVAEHYKMEKPSTNKQAAWAQKPGNMATGKDFWNELRKQVATLQKGESTNKGG